MTGGNEVLSLIFKEDAAQLYVDDAELNQKEPNLFGNILLLSLHEQITTDLQHLYQQVEKNTEQNIGAKRGSGGLSSNAWAIKHV